MSVTDKEILSRYVTDICGQDAFKQTVLMISFARVVQNPAMQGAIVPLMSMILDFMGSDQTQQLPFNASSFFQSTLFNLHVNDVIMSPEEYEEKTRSLRTYSNAFYGLFKSHQALGKEILRSIDETPVKSKKFLGFLVSKKMDDAKAVGKIIVLLR